MHYKPSKIPAGAIYGRLTVIGVAHKKGWWTYYTCRCRCGQTACVCGRELAYGKTKSCGCLQRETAPKNSQRLPSGVAAQNKLFYRYRWAAKKRGLVWKLSETAFRKLALDVCHYCGDSPKQIHRTEDGNGDFVYNGVDRKDNEIGYVENNCVSCCKQCNFAKRNLNYPDFIAWLIRAGSRHRHQ